MVTVTINRKYNIGRHVGSVMNPPLRRSRSMNSPKQTRRSVNAIRFHEPPAETNAPKDRSAWFVQVLEVLEST